MSISGSRWVYLNDLPQQRQMSLTDPSLRLDVSKNMSSGANGAGQNQTLRGSCHISLCFAAASLSSDGKSHNLHTEAFRIDVSEFLGIC